MPFVHLIAAGLLILGPFTCPRGPFHPVSAKCPPWHCHYIIQAPFKPPPSPQRLRMRGARGREWQRWTGTAQASQTASQACAQTKNSRRSLTTKQSSARMIWQLFFHLEPSPAFVGPLLCTPLGPSRALPPTAVDLSPIPASSILCHLENRYLICGVVEKLGGVRIQHKRWYDTDNPAC
jgi:hypothetical protein